MEDRRQSFCLLHSAFRLLLPGAECRRDYIHALKRDVSTNLVGLDRLRAESRWPQGIPLGGPCGLAAALRAPRVLDGECRWEYIVASTTQVSSGVRVPDLSPTLVAVVILCDECRWN